MRHAAVAVETEEYVAFARRVVRGLGRRLHGASPDEFVAIVELHHEFETMLAEAVQEYVAADAALGTQARTQTWTEVGRMFGISRQAAEQRFSPAGRERKRRLQAAYRQRRATPSEAASA